MTKMTYVAALTKAIEVLTADAQLDADLTPVVDRLIELKAKTEKRNKADRKPTPKEIAKAEADAVLMEDIAKLMADGEMRAVKDIAIELELSSAKVSAIVRKMVDAGRIDAIKVGKGRTHLYKVAG